MTKLTRRQILVSLCAAGGLGGVAILLQVVGPRGQYRKRVLELNQLFQGLVPCLALGQQLLATRKMPADVEALSARLFSDVLKIETEDFTGYFKQAIMAEHFAGQTHTHEGWVITDTEACLCALLALLTPAAAARSVAKAASQF